MNYPPTKITPPQKPLKAFSKFIGLEGSNSSTDKDSSSNSKELLISLESINNGNPKDCTFEGFLCFGTKSEDDKYVLQASFEASTKQWFNFCKLPFFLTKSGYYKWAYFSGIISLSIVIFDKLCLSLFPPELGEASGYNFLNVTLWYSILSLFNSSVFEFATGTDKLIDELFPIAYTFLLFFPLTSCLGLPYIIRTISEQESFWDSDSKLKLKGPIKFIDALKTIGIYLAAQFPALWLVINF